MSFTEPPPGAGPPESPAGRRLESWKEIATYLKRDESTVRRWESEGLPVHRHAHKKKASVYAYAAEIDAWRNNGHAEAAPEPAPVDRRRSWAAAAVLVGVALAAGLALNVGGVRDRLRRPRAGEITSIAVLPLKNLSGDAGQDYFAEGMTEALITELGKIGALRVKSHQSVIGYRGSDKPLPQIARELNVDAVLEGTVLHSGGRVRITANLVQPMPEERHLWANSYDRDLKDVLALQGDVAQKVAGAIRMTLTPQEQARLTGSRQVDPEAYTAYLLGRALLLKPGGKNRARAQEYLEKAVEKDPGFAPAYASLAEVFVRTRGSSKTNPGERRVQARQWAMKALALDDTLAEAHDALARASQQEWDWAGAEREYRLAIKLNPSYTVARIWYAMYLFAMRRFDESVEEAHRAQLLDPASPFINTYAGNAYFYGGRVDEAMASWRRALELDPDFPDASLSIARTDVLRGRYAQAVAQLQEAIGAKKEPDVLLLGVLAHALAREGRREEALKLVDELKRRDAEARELESPFGLIYAYVGLDDREQAFAWLERGYEMAADRMIFLNIDVLLQPLRADPRFHDLVRRIGLPAESPPPSG